MQITLNEEKRIDKIELEGLSRSRLANLIEEGCVSVNGKIILKPSFKAKAGDEITINIPEVKEIELKPEKLDIRIIYEDDDFAMVYKPCGMVVHPAPGHQTGTLVSALLYQIKDLSGIGGEKRPGIIHRLDKDTSGLLIIAKNDFAHMELSKQLKARQMEKHYFALVHGVLKDDEGEIITNIARSQKDRKKMSVQMEGKEAITKWKVIERFPAKTLLDVNIITGRTHQIRVHMAHIAHPIIGDVIYGTKNSSKAERLMLQACQISFFHPRTNEKLSFSMDIDESIKNNAK